MSFEQLLAWIPPGSPDEALAREIDFERLPSHVAMIMDGNGRWAAQRHLPRVEGHRAGIASVRDAVETSARLGIDVLTLYAFSIENWKRPRTEITTLMMLLKRYIRLEIGALNRTTSDSGHQSHRRSRSRRAGSVLGIRQTEKNTGMLFNIARITVDARRSWTRRAARLPPAFRPKRWTNANSVSFSIRRGSPIPIC